MQSVAKEKGLSVSQAVFPMIGSILGSGILTLPRAVEFSGYMISGPILAFISAICAFTLFQLVHCAKNLDDSDPSYFKVCQNTFSLLGYIAEGSIGAQGFGSIFVYFLILRGWISGMLGIEEKIKSFPYNVLFSIGLILFPTFLAMQKNLKKLGVMSILSTISVSFLSLIVLVSGALALFLPDNNIKRDVLKKTTSSPADIFAALSCYIFGLGCQQNMVRVFSLMEKPTKANGAKVGSYAILAASIAYFLVANGGYIAGGNGQDRSILDILMDKDRYFYKVVHSNFGPGMGDMYFYLISLSKMAMSVVLLGAYPLQMHPTRDSVISFLNLLAKKQIESNRRLTEIAVTGVITLAIFLLSFGDFKYTFVMNLIANTASCYIMFSLPSIAYIASQKKKLSFTLISWGILVGSILFSLFGTYNLFAV
ncbi:hypothetical protein NEAUS05_2186 [Nematocida ausubeli]|uniref:Amino acid transporter transmembrane domain-containing protein n=1 Tax=Nematocida ausubeli (strain ATCC PRA-371 / ERTm2) TaxID=1913371 RepID=H8ZFY1_NEMA1|nr:hypothetical protein NERG_02502 [Nematocida ausubeli]KAI5133799.1 hypothetical protein NEAUS07_0572 [Nematocida ausubeli]KAI5134594.1 hypothetical protein NEAUS06_1183 [Nematocida ausubeli]KAI5150481.1 hypothetical protein NEAUS05_2186 [Nematocida ausubeli]